jgi:hypothetical protein
VSAPRLTQPSVDGYQPADLATFESLGDLLAFERGLKVKDAHTSLQWYNNETREDSQRLALEGRNDWVRTAEEVCSVVEAGAMPLERQSWQAAPMGAFPVVPEVLAGLPDNMRLRRSSLSEYAPVSLVLDLTSSCGLTSADLVKRGAALAALALALQAVRPVTLWLCAGLDSRHNRSGVFTKVRINTSPLDLAQFSYLTGSCGFQRRLLYGICAQHGARGAWPDFKAMGGATEQERRAYCQALELEETDIVIPGIVSSDKTIRSPLTWIEGHLARFRKSLVTQEGEME